MILTALIIIVTSKIDFWLYPVHYEQEVSKYAQMYNVDKSLAEAVMREESKFNENATSKSGAIGLMQIMPETGAWIAQQLNEDKDCNLYETERNIRYGIWYLSELTKEFGGNKVLALAAYNAGRGTVWDWIEDYEWDKDFDSVDEIPYEETREYVKRVMRSQIKYETLYFKD